MVTGIINLIQRGETEHRVSDIFVGREEPFVVIFHATMGELIDKILVINKRHVVWVIPEEEASDEKRERLEISNHGKEGLATGNHRL